MTAERWRGTIDGFLQNLIFAERLDDRLVEKAAKGIISRSISGKSPEVYCRDIQLALQADEALSEMIPTRHIESDFRDFLRRLHDRLDELRPWPEPPYVKLKLADCICFDTEPAFAAIDASSMTVSEALRLLFDRLPSGDGWVGLVLRLRTGETIGLRGRVPHYPSVTIHQCDDSDPATTIKHFSELTGFASDQITPLV